MKWACVLILGALVSCATGSFEQTVEITGLRMPESVIYDQKRGELYVSNLNGSFDAREGSGFLSRVAPTGEINELRWVTGLNAPKGMGIAGDTLYVTDIDHIVEINIDTGTIVGRYPVPNALFLNDIGIDETGNVYASDMFGNSIYRLADGVVELWLSDDELESPNGLVVQGSVLFVACYGQRHGTGFLPKWPGHVKTVSLNTREIESFGDGRPVGNLDGLEPDGRGNFFVTDFNTGALVLVRPSGESVVLIELAGRIADHEFVEHQRLVFIPLTFEDRVVGYRVPRRYY